MDRVPQWHWAIAVGVLAAMTALSYGESDTRSGNRSNTSHGGDLEVTDIKVTYLDDRTDPDSVTRRELRFFKDVTFWSKPESVDVEVSIRNAGSRLVNADVHVELFLLLQGGDLAYPAFEDESKELKEVSNKPVWVWNRTFPTSGGPTRLKPDEIAARTIKGVMLKPSPIGNLSSMYSIHALGFRAVGTVYPIGKDKFLRNNVLDHVVKLLM